MTKAGILIRGAWVKWHALGYIGVDKRKRFRHLAVTDEDALRFWEKIYNISRQP